MRYRIIGDKKSLTKREFKREAQNYKTFGYENIPHVFIPDSVYDLGEQAVESYYRNVLQENVDKIELMKVGK